MCWHSNKRKLELLFDKSGRVNQKGLNYASMLESRATIEPVSHFLCSKMLASRDSLATVQNPNCIIITS